MSVAGTLAHEGGGEGGKGAVGDISLCGIGHKQPHKGWLEGKIKSPVRSESANISLKKDGSQVIENRVMSDKQDNLQETAPDVCHIQDPPFFVCKLPPGMADG